MGKANDWDVPNFPTLKNMKEYSSVSRLSQEKVSEVYSNIAHFLPDAHRAYLEKLLRGEAEVDALLDLEIFFRLVTLYSTQAITWAMEGQDIKVTKDIGSILGEVRQGAVAIESMRNKRVEAQTKKEMEESGVDYDSRKSALEFFESSN